MTEVYLGGKRLRLDPNNAFGKGGEADVYDIGNDRVLKVFKAPGHPDFAGSPELDAAAEQKISEHQKKLRAFPKGLPDRVIAPLELATDRTGARILGYVMRRVRGDELIKFGERSFRSGIPNLKVRDVFRELHALVGLVHRARVVIGDFNDLNVIVTGTSPHLIDADSFQFGQFLSRVYTERFVDPVLCDPAATRPVLARPHTADSDWYAFAVMLMQSLLFVDPYGGLHRPPQGKPVPQALRPLKRITVFHDEVRYPKPAVPYGTLPDDLLHHLHAVFIKDARGEFPLRLIERLEWRACAVCGAEHARAVCPVCKPAAPAAVITTTVVRGKVTATTLFKTPGVILRAVVHGGKLRWLCHEGDAYTREGGGVVLRGDLDPRMRVRLKGDDTLLGKDGTLIVLSGGGQVRATYAVDEYAGALPVFDTNETNVFWTQSGHLRKEGMLGASEIVGDVLSGHTLFWAGPTFGFGLYRAGELAVAFVFDASSKGINDGVKLPRIAGRLIDANCAFTSERCWFFTTTQEGSRTVNRAVVIRRNGDIEATAEAVAGDGSWLSVIGGACAVGTNLFVPTDDGIVRVAVANGTAAKTSEFPDTEPFVDAATKLLPGSQGLLAIGRKEIVALKLT